MPDPRIGRQGILLGLLVVACLTGCADRDAPLRVTLWHQMPVGERGVLEELIAQFEAGHPDIEIRALYKETEELRSGFQAAALAGTGPELVYGPSDSLGAYVTMGIVQDLRPWFSVTETDQFVDSALTWLPLRGGDGSRALVQVGDRVGNHLALVYNRNLVAAPPETTDQLIELAQQLTVDADGDGRTDQYGLVWNFVEPFFFIPFLTGEGGWVFAEDGITPDLDSPACRAALRFVRDLQQKYRVLPANCDYETADALFKSGAAAMIINGDWSWGDYLQNPDIDAAIAPLPVLSSTGRPLGPMVATKGYSLNVHAAPREADAAMEFVQFMTSRETQRELMGRLKTLPSRRELLDDPLLSSDPTLVASAQQMKNGQPMPVVAELRAIWDAMRPPYQALLAGNREPAEAAAEMQQLASEKIRLMNRQVPAGWSAWVLKGIAALLVVSLLVWQRKSWGMLVRDWQKQPLAYWLIGPSLIVIAATIVYPFCYNIVLSFSNMSLRNFQDWQITGWQNYQQVFSRDSALAISFYEVLFKTLVWTGVCVFFHVAIGLLLAVALNGPVRGKSIYRVLLILPWAVPAYITALTWRGMFDYEYGAINLMANRYLGLPPVNWLGDETNALVACILTNIWLGFPFMMIIALGGMQGIPSELYEAARIDRVPRWKQFFHITLPMLRPVLLPAVTLGTIWTFNNLNVVWLVSNGGEPSDQTHILVSFVYKAVFNLYQYGYGAALSMVIFLMLLAFSLLFLWRTRATEGVA